ncbi:proliferation-associated protein 2G4-like [Tubulanus polymorphus]|uniref:proliferation-associated protein 2G4-like n=1 Tax=Tubulanus polymorphus TaxID=672921 RepID=UPI003DA5ECF7
MAAVMDDHPELTIAEDIVVTKYKMAGDMVNGILKEIVSECVEGKNIIDICKFGDRRLQEETSNVFKKEKEMKKGIAFPTCISVNNCICHYSPLESEITKAVVLKKGDVVKIDFGAHIDGFPAMVAHTLVVGASKDNKVTGRKADVIMAAYYASEVALRLIVPPNDNYKVTDAIQKVAEEFSCKPIEGMLSYQLQQHTIDGEKAIIQNPTENQRKDHEKKEFELHEVYALDMLISTGEGRGKEMESKTTVYKRRNETYSLKMKAARNFFSEVTNKFSFMPFTLRACEDEKKARLGVVECVNHHLLEPFNVLYEKDNEFVAQFKFTVLLMPNGPMKITGLKFDSDLYESEHSVQQEELKTILATSVSRKSAKNKKKKAEKAMLSKTSEPAKA